MIDHLYCKARRMIGSRSIFEHTVSPYGVLRQAGDGKQKTQISARVEEPGGNK